MAFVTRIVRPLLLLRNNVRIPSLGCNYCTSNQLDIVPDYTPDQHDEIELKRNKSRLQSRHYSILHGLPGVDVENPRRPYEETAKFKRKLIGRYGSASGLSISVCWPKPEELCEMIEYEKVAHPFSLHEMIERNKADKELHLKQIAEREAEIELKIGKLEGWKKELRTRKEKKLAETRTAQEKKDNLIEEVRQHFGYQVSLKDPKFQEMYDKLEKEAKKAEKEAKKKTRFEKATSKFISEQQKTEK